MYIVQSALWSLSWWLGQCWPTLTQYINIYSYCQTLVLTKEFHSCRFSYSFNSPMKDDTAHTLTNKQKQGQLLTQLLYSFLGDPTGLVTIHVSAWLHLCSGRTTHWSLSHWVLREEQPNHSHMSCQHDRLSEGSLHLLQSRVKRLSFYLISLGLHILRSPRALTPWTMRPFSSSVKSIWDLEEQSTPPSLASSTEKEREGRRDTCLQVIRM